MRHVILNLKALYHFTKTHMWRNLWDPKIQVTS